MNQTMLDKTEELCRRILFGRPYNHCEVLDVLNYCQDHQSVKVYRNTNGFLSLCYCGRCSTIVAEGDLYCNQCGRELRWND